MKPELRMGLEFALAELEGNRLEVILVPSRVYVNEGGCIRVAISKNARWYREFCADYPSGRNRRKAGSDTRIKRANIVSVLNTLINRGDSRSAYAPHLLKIAQGFAPRAEAVA